MTCERIQLPVEVRFLRVPTDWSLKTDAQGRRVAVPTVSKAEQCNLNQVDGYELRRKFLRMNDEKTALQFLQEVGLWDFFEDRSAGKGSHANELHGSIGSRLFCGRAPEVPLTELRETRDWWRRVLRNNAEVRERFGEFPSNIFRFGGREAKGGDAKFLFALQTKFLNHFELHIEWRKGKAFAVIETATAEEMLNAVLHLDLLRGAKFRMCARGDCSIPFSFVGAYKKKFCDWSCAHVVAERKRRRRKNREEKHNATKW
jgi:hypothetical protein